MSSTTRKPAASRANPPLPFLLHVLVYPEGDEWLAHCLEFDTVAQGTTPAEARRGLEDALDLLIADATEHGDIRGLFRPAPAELWTRYAGSDRRGRLRKVTKRDLSLDDRLAPA